MNGELAKMSDLANWVMGAGFYLLVVTVLLIGLHYLPKEKNHD